MRIQRLDLIRYGCFSGTTIELPSAKADIHILYGPNEAGKSTGLNSMTDLLFGVPVRTSFGFLHEPSCLRIGAVLENGAERLSLVRRKGAKDTLLDLDGLALPGAVGALERLLGGADRAFFERMFGLDHARLRTGGREILEAKDDIGRALFSAGSGIVGLREHLEALRSEADGLWSRRRAKHRAYYAALDRVKETEETIRERTLSADRWHELKRAVEVAEEAYADLDAEFRKRSGERYRLSRIRRVHRNVRRKRELDRALGSLGEVILLPEDAGAELAAAERAEADAGTAVAALAEAAERVRAELATLRPNENLLARADEIRALRDRGIEIRAAKNDLPHHEAELEAVEKEFGRLGAELGWEGNDTGVLARRIPPQVEVGAARTLLNGRAELEAALRAEGRALRESEVDLERREKTAARAPEPVDVTKLTHAIDAVRDRSDLTERVRIAESRVVDLRARAERALSSLHPGVESEEALAAVRVPTREEVERHREEERAWQERSTQVKTRAESLRRELDGARAARERLLGEGDAVSAAALSEARARRDGLWSLVRRLHVEGAALTEELLRGYQVESGDLVGAYERSVVDADALSDRRFEHAEAAGRLAEVERTELELGRRLAECEADQERLRERGGQLAAARTTLWRDSPFEPSDPERMLAWLEARSRILEARAERHQTANAHNVLRTEERDARQLLVVELVALGVDTGGLDALSLSALVETALDERRRRLGESETGARLLAECEKARRELERRRAELSATREARSSWQENWTAAVAALGLDPDRSPESVEPRLEIIERARGMAVRIDSLRDTVARINRETARFERSAGELAGGVAPDLEGAPAKEIVLAMERRLGEAERVRSLRAAKEAEMKALDARITEHREALARASTSVAHLMYAAGVESSSSLKRAIDRSDRRRALVAERDATAAKLLEDGDGLEIEVLAQECADIDLHEATARETEAQAELECLQSRLADSAQARSRARDAFEVLGGSDAAARAAADREDALANLRGIAARYVRARGSALLLEWVIDRYRRERQAPLLARARELFETLTAGAFTALGIEYDKRDRPFLVGVRPGGEAVPVSGLSSGTADQLFLALRIGAVEEYLAKASALPFVADDLFIHFDDDRAAAGLKVLERLSRTTQVLFFTHHRHLVDIACETLEPSLDVIDLSGDPEGPATVLEAA